MPRPDGITLTVAPDRVFVRLVHPSCEMTPAEAERVAASLIDAASMARAVPYGSSLLEIFQCSS